MAKKKIVKIVGYISHEVAEQYNLYEYENKEIVQALDFYKHSHKHIDEFESIDNYNNSVLNIEKILSEPSFVYYDNDKNSLRYFKEIDENVCAIVKLNLRKNKDTYVATIYPVSKYKMQKFKDKALLEKYRYKEKVC